MATPIPQNQAAFTVDEIVAATRGTIVHRGPGAPVRGVVTDSRAITKGSLFVPLRGDRHDAHRFIGDAVAGGATAVVVARGAHVPSGLSAAVVEVEDTTAALGDLAHAHRARWKGALVAITGSAGKTTTKELTAAALSGAGARVHKTRGNLNNLIGVPMTLFELADTHDTAVVEMGTSQPGEIARLAEIAQPDVGVVTLVAAAHTEGLGSIEAVAREKWALIEALRSDAHAVINADDPWLTQLASAAGASPGAEPSEAPRGVRGSPPGRTTGGGGRVGYDGAGGAENRRADASPASSPGGAVTGARRSRTEILSFGYADGATVRIAGHELLPDLTTRAHYVIEEVGDLEVPLALLGEAAARNAAAALAVCIALGRDVRAGAKGLASVEPEPGRMCPVTARSGALVLDDTYNANPRSTALALDTAAELAAKRGGSVIAVLGDMMELGERSTDEHASIGRHAAAAGVRILAACGHEMRHAVSAARRASRTMEVHHYDDPMEAAARVLDESSRRDVILVKGSRSMQMERVVAGVVS